MKDRFNHPPEDSIATEPRIFKLLADLVLLQLTNRRKIVPLQLAALQLLEEAVNARFLEAVPLKIAQSCVRKVAATIVKHHLGHSNNRVWCYRIL